MSSENDAKRAYRDGDRLVMGMSIDDLMTLDPAEGYERTVSELLGNVYERLVRLDRDDLSRIKPEAAESWTISPDGLRFSFRLRPNLKFSSGNPVTADDVAWSFKRAVTCARGPAEILNELGLTPENVSERAVADDEQTFRLTLNAAFAPSFVLNCLTSNAASIVDRKTVEQVCGADADAPTFGNDWLKRNTAGSGPFTVSDWCPGQAVALTRNEFSRQRTSLAVAEYRHIPDGATQLDLLLEGKIDVARSLDFQQLEIARQSGVCRVSAAPKGAILFISLNQRHPLLSKPQVIRAFKHLVDYETMQQQWLEGSGRVHQGFLPLGMLGSEDKTRFAYDPQEARRLLVEAGLGSGFQISMDVHQFPTVMGVASIFQKSLALVGVELTLLPDTGKSVLGKFRGRKHDLYCGRWGTDYWDPNSNAKAFLKNTDNGSEKEAGILAWRNGWSAPELSRMADDALTISDPNLRAERYRLLQDEVVSTAPYIFIYQQVEYVATRDWFTTLSVGPTFGSNYLFDTVDA
ncbi:ABC transporter substrate-binding protein [Neorhizobium sp. IRAMC:178]|uniref:ABC transporter substrate-binding protein n=1 Tax=Neorhizobium tunisiense TaxID=3144793 RepID=UPI0031F69A64